MNLSSLLCLQFSSLSVLWAFVSSVLCASLQVGFMFSSRSCSSVFLFFYSNLNLERNSKIGCDWVPLMILIFQFSNRVEGLSSLSCGLLRRFANGFSIEILMRLKHEAVFLGRHEIWDSNGEWKRISWIIDLLIPTGDDRSENISHRSRTFSFVKLSPNDIEFMSRSDVEL